RLKEISDFRLQQILERRNTVASVTLFKGRLIPIDEPVPKSAFASFIIRIKPGLDTLVVDKDEIKTLGEYAAIPKSYFGSTLYGGLDKFDNKRLVIRWRKN
ncbi:unnamed protein product, partial [marine sediment metagenome]